ncbi:MAG TPA: hypothetical protein IAC03_07275 [Candidatus Coprenecus pullistercoris]|nr:hypothetical protein [Candidatus Coprenecus pullistercoris]
MEYTNILTIKFANHIKRTEIPLFRGAIINALPSDNILYHNHTDNGFRYSYPLIQYKRINGCAAIVCIGEGTEAISDFFTDFKPDVTIGEQLIHLEIDTIKPRRILIQPWNDMLTYRISTWIPFNQDNYGQFKALDSLAERYAMLERILTGNILSFAKGIGIHFDNQVICRITDVFRFFETEYKSVKHTAINAEFQSNISLPDNIGLGKGVSIGNGTIRMYRSRKQDNTTD